jgi:DNA mismatch repair protein MLH1
MKNSKQTAPPRIQALEKQVVDRIAAGEVVQRPASVAKELIENSLDADATAIDVHCASGGLGFLSITDDGVGFHRDDLPLAATRFATSKLVRFDDLNSIKTFGFRGEALASASMVGHLTIISRKRQLEGTCQAKTKRRNDCAYKLSFVDGKPNGKPLPSAGKIGTQVKIEDLFYNIQSRRRAFEGSKKENDEYYKILNVVQRYAVHCSGNGVGFVCRKRAGVADLNTCSLSTLKRIQKARKDDNFTRNSIDGKKLSETAIRETIGHLFGSELVRELLVLEASEGNINSVQATNDYVTIDDEVNGLQNEPDMHEALNETNTDEILEREDQEGLCTSRSTFAFKAFGLCTNGSYCGTKSSSAFILFINDRLVESGPIRRAVEGLYMDIIPRGAKPFIYLSLELPGFQIDVNIHPTKREIAILHEDRLCSALTNTTLKLLHSAKTSKTFHVQALLPIVTNTSTKKGESRKRKLSALEPTVKAENKEKPELRKKSPHSTKEIQSKNIIRVSAAAETGALEPFLTMSYKKADHNEMNRSKSLTHREASEFEYECNCEFKLKKIDLNIPGAFASICRCQIDRPGSFPLTSSQSRTIIRPKKILPTDCSYSSIVNLRKDVTSNAHRELTGKLRESIFVGCVSRHRSLIQSGIELLIINHVKLARELFYQLTLTQFGGLPGASLNSRGIDVALLLEKALQFEDAQNLFTSVQHDTGSVSKSKDLNQMIELLALKGKDNFSLKMLS